MFNQSFVVKNNAVQNRLHVEWYTLIWATRRNGIGIR